MNRKSRRLGATLSPAPPGPLALLGAGLFLAGVSGLSGGCEFQSDLKDSFSKIYPSRTDLVATGHVKGVAVSGPAVVVSLPTVFRENEDLVVSGTVTRRPDQNGSVPGFLDVQ